MQRYINSAHENLVVQKKKNISKNFDEKMLDTIGDNLLPCVTLICILTDLNKFIHTLYTFLKLNYPKDKLELIIVDDLNLEKKLKQILPNDARFRYINVNKKPKHDNKGKDTNDSIKFPLGYKLNIGVKYAKHNLIGHFFDTNLYIPENFKNIVKSFVISGKDALLSNESGYYIESSKESHVSMASDLANMLYIKDFWNFYKFENQESDKYVILHKFITFRTDVILYIPFLYYSFCFNKSSESKLKTQILNLDLINLLQKPIQESYKLIHL
jgi:hypothetical protein